MSEAARRIAVTGALGFVASRLLPHLLLRGGKVVAILRPGREAMHLERAGVEVRRAHLDDPAGPGSVFEGVGTVIHLAGMAQFPRLRTALEGAGVRRGVFVSSTGVYTQLESPGAAAKRMAEATLKRSALAYTLFRPSMIYGTPADRNIARLLRWIRTVPVVPLPGGGTTLQQPVHVDDLVAAILSALDRPESARREYDVGGPEAVSLRELVDLCGEAVGRRVHVLPLPLGPVHGVIRLLGRLRIPTPVRPEQVLRLRESKAVDITAARCELGFAPRSLMEGLRAEVDELRFAG